MDRNPGDGGDAPRDPTQIAGAVGEQQGRAHAGPQGRGQGQFARQRLRPPGDPGPVDVLGGPARVSVGRGLNEPPVFSGHGGVGPAEFVSRTAQTFGKGAAGQTQAQAENGRPQPARRHDSAPGARVRSQRCASGTTRRTRLA
jgi:hypothetical protein